MFDALNKSYAIRKALGDQQGIARMHISFGSAYLLTGKTKTARAECHLGLELAEPLEAMAEIKDACICLYSSYKELGDNETALKYYERANAVDKEMAQTETQRQLQIMEFHRQVTADSIAREREKESIAQHHADEIRKESNERTVLLFSGIFLLISSVVLFLFFRRASRSKKMIEEEKSRRYASSQYPACICHQRTS
jgi:tetratricopeptide (TPR) repeat protein